MSPRFDRIDAWRVRIPATGRMRVPGLLFADETLMRSIAADKSAEQVCNVAELPGIVGHSLAMPDMHWGYGFPIGGVAAFDEHDGVLSPGGVGYDINCGVRLLRSGLVREDVVGQLDALSMALYKAVPCGVGSRSELRLDRAEFDDVLQGGARWAVEAGLGEAADLGVMEEDGCFGGADPAKVSSRAKDRGRPQIGSLGSGNHFCELGYVAEIYDPEAAVAYGLVEQGVTLLIHSGSRGLGHQVCDDALHGMLAAATRYGIELPDRQLCAAPLSSPEAQDYFAAMACAINFAFANRQVMTDAARRALARFFGGRDEARLELVYDVCHNIAKWEHHQVDGATRRLCVHRKGATRAFGPGHPDVPERYRDVGQPVLVPGDMGRYSFVLKGQTGAMLESFGSCCHGAGRRLSRVKAKQLASRRPILQELRKQGVFVRADSKNTVAEEIPDAYKDVADVVGVVAGAGLAGLVAKLVPLAVVKG